MSAERMQSDLLTYFEGEGTGALLLIAVGVVGLAIGAVLLVFRRRPAARGALVPVLLFAILELVVGSAVWLRTDDQVSALLSLLSTEPATMVTAELGRIGQVLTTLGRIHVAELILLVGSALVFPWAAFTRREWVQGLVLGLGLQSAVAFGVDGWAASRARTYQTDLASFEVSLPRAIRAQPARR